MTSTVDRIVADALRVTLSHPAACGCAGCAERERRRGASPAETASPSPYVPRVGTSQREGAAAFRLIPPPSRPDPGPTT